MARLAAAVSGLALLFASATTASAIRLDVLQGQTTVLPGLINIQWTKVGNPTGAFDLSAIELVMVSDGHGVGFDLVAGGDAFGVGSGGLGDLLLEFTVSATAAITQVTSVLDASVGGDLSGASVFERIAEYEPAHVTTWVFESDVQNPVSVELPPLLQLTITKNAIVTAGDSLGGGADYARIDLLSQRFTVVPEPGTALLLGLGLAGTALARRRADGEVH